jgi:proline dehydrogenase
MLWLAGNRQAEQAVRGSRFTRPLVERFVAGEDLDSAIDEVRKINGRGMTVTLDLLGESVSNSAAADAARDAFVGILDRIQTSGVESNISIKLTMLGLDIDEETTWQRLEQIVGKAHATGNFVRIDMEAAPYTDRTLGFFRRIHDLYPENVGIVLQSYLYRTDLDIEEMIERKARVRLVKGAYKEPETVAYPHKSDVDASYRRQMERLLDAGNYPAIATHDETLLTAARAYATRNSVDPSRFEFQMLYGVRRDLQQLISDQGYNVRVYVPYGTMWYPYFMRRLAERPANVFFIARNLVRQ